MERQSSTLRPFNHSVATEDDAIALPHPNVLNLASIIVPFSSTSNCNFITSPQAGAPTKPVPTLQIFSKNQIKSIYVFFFLSRLPTFLGFS